MTGSSTSTSSWMLLPMLLALFVISSFSAPATNEYASARSAQSARSATGTNRELEALKECSDTSSKTQLNISVSQSNSPIQYFIEGIKLLNCNSTENHLISNLSDRLKHFCENITTSGCVPTEPYPSHIEPKEFHEKLKTLFQCYNSRK